VVVALVGEPRFGDKDHRDGAWALAPGGDLVV